MNQKINIVEWMRKQKRLVICWRMKIIINKSYILIHPGVDMMAMTHFREILIMNKLWELNKYRLISIDKEMYDIYMLCEYIRHFSKNNL